MQYTCVDGKAQKDKKIKITVEIIRQGMQGL
jgi:hypothetical protein